VNPSSRHSNLAANPALFRYVSDGTDFKTIAPNPVRPMLTLLWTSLLLLLLAACQILTGCWLSMYMRCKDPGRAWKTLWFCLRTRKFDPEILRSRLGID
jgi:hypothetical protein